MLHGSVIWFKPKEGQGSGKTRINNNVKDVIRLRSGSRNTPQRQNKSLDVDESAVENVKKTDNKNGQTNPRNKQVSQPRTSKSIEQNKRDNEDPVLKDIAKNASNHGETSKNAAKSGRGSAQNRRKNSGQNRRGHKIRAQNQRVNKENAQKKTIEATTVTNDRAQNRRKNNGQNRRGHKSRAQNRRVNKENAQKKKENDKIEETTVNNDNRSEHKNRAQNIRVNKENAQKKTGNKKIEETTVKVKSNEKDPENIDKYEHDVKEEVRTSSADLSSNPKGRIVDDNKSKPSSQQNLKEKEIIKEVKSKIAEQIEDKVVQKIKEVQTTQKPKERTRTEPPKKSKEPEETKPLTDTEKQKVVENADLLGLILAQSDPGLVKVLLDNSSPENLNVFLSNSDITVEELKDIIAY